MIKTTLIRTTLCALIGVMAAQARAYGPTDVQAPGASIHAGPGAGWGQGSGWNYNYERGEGGHIFGPGWSVSFGSRHGRYNQAQRWSPNGHGDLRHR